MTHIPDEWLSSTEPGLSVGSHLTLFVGHTSFLEERSVTETYQQHISVMPHETLAALQVESSGIYVDATFGRGGHARRILERLGPNGRLICTDKDPEAIAFGQSVCGADPRVEFIQASFGELKGLMSARGLKGKIQGVLCDLGVSSPQLEDARRGFSFLRDGPLDMRMDPTSRLSASAWINQAECREIASVLRKYGEEAHAMRIARALVAHRDQAPITTTSALADLVAACVPYSPGKHPATKTFQAIRIHINQELQALEQVLPAALDVLAPGGRLAMISFHSLEDRAVKRFFRAHSAVSLPRGLGLPEAMLTVPMRWVIKRQCPSQEEIARNPRARSATLRVAEKIG